MQEFYECRDRFSAWLKDRWEIEFKSVRRDLKIEGSPERTVSRIVIEDKYGALFLLEKFAKSKYALRRQVASAVAYLNDNGLSRAVACIRDVKGGWLPFFNGACYQISKFHTSTGIKRPQYLSSVETGRSFADFLVCLSGAADGIETIIEPVPFSIKSYIYTLFKKMKVHDPDVYDAFCPVLSFLEEQFMDVHDSLPLGFCHGDLHPLNVIWDHDRILAVIDWEFTGFKPEIYDAANLIGCAGIENPNGLGREMVMTFISGLRKCKVFNETGWRYFPEYLIALRFAWLSEWLRKKDVPMIEMEAAYLKLLIKNIDVLRKGWDIG